MRTIRGPYDPRERVGLDCGDEVLTKQSFKDECDINVIMRNYMKTGVLPSADPNMARYLDCTAIDFQAAMLMVVEAQTAFAELPSSVRDRFHNEPGELLAFIGDVKNRDEAVKLGLVVPPPVAPPPIVVTVAPGSSELAPAAVVP